MNEKRYFKIEYDEEWYLFDSTTISEQLVKEQAEYGYGVFANSLSPSEICDVLNEQQELIEELQVSDEMGWKRAERFEKKCPKELHNKKMYIKRLEYKVQKFKEENEQLKKEHKIAIDEMITDYKELEKENEQLIKMGLKWQGENPCATCVYPDPNVQKLCCAYVSPILTEEARESFVQGLCTNYKRIRGL